MKKFLKIVSIAILALVALLFLTGFFFSGKIGSIAKKQINKSVNAEVDFGKVNVSFLRSFPNVSLGLNDLQILKEGNFENDTLLSAKSLQVSVDLMSFLKGDQMKVNKVFVNKPRIHAYIDDVGNANWDIMKESPGEDEEDKPFNLELKEYEIKDGYVLYDDRPGKMKAEIAHLNHKGSGDFSADQYTLSTHTDAKEVSFVYAAIPYLSSVKTDIDTDIQINNQSNTYTLKDLTILLNALKINGDGSVAMRGDGYDIDLTFDAPSTDFKDILSLIPTVYKQDFKDLKASGTASFNGLVKGTYNEKSIPGYQLSLKINDGSFQYPDLPMAVEQVNVDADVNNPDGITDHTVIDIRNSSVKLGKDKFDFRLLFKNPMTTQYVDAAAKGTLDLGAIKQFIKLEKGTDLGGVMNSDLTVKGNISDLEKKQYANFYAGGTLGVNGFKYVSNDYPEGVEISRLASRFSPSSVDVSTLIGKYMGTNFSGNANISNLLNYIFGDQPLSAVVAFKGDKIDLNKWMGVAASDSASNNEAETIGGGPFVVPANLNVQLNAQVDDVSYDNLDIHNLSGGVRVADQTVYLNGVKGNALDGTMTVNGTYSTKADKKNPDISINYNIDKVDIQKTFYAFNTAKKLMPIGKFLAGKLTSSLNASGKLSEGMDVKLNSLTGNGNLLLIEGVLSKFAPLDKIASTLGIAQLQNISLKNINTFIEFTNSKILVKPFNLKIGDIDMEIGGLQGIDQSIDYSVNLKLPRKLLGKQGNDLINNLASSVAKTGIPVDLGETVNLMLKLGGTVNSPTIKTDFKNSAESLAAQFSDQLKDFAQEKADNLKQAAKDSIASLRQKATESLKDEVKKQLLGKSNADSTKSDTAKAPSNIGKDAEKAAKGILKGLFGKKKEEPEKSVDSTEK